MPPKSRPTRPHAPPGKDKGKGKGKGKSKGVERWAVRLSIDHGAKKAPAFGFPQDVPKERKPYTTSLAYGEVKSTLKTNGPIWPKQEVVMEETMRAKKALEADPIDAFARWHGETLSTTIGPGAVVPPRMRRSQQFTMGKRPPTGLVSGEALRNTNMRLIDPPSAFGNQTLSKSRSEGGVFILTKPKERKMSAVDPFKQWPGDPPSCLGRQVNSRSRTASAGVKLRPRPEPFPVAKQLSDVGPARFLPESTLTHKGYVMPPHPLDKGRRARTAAGRMRARPNMGTQSMASLSRPKTSGGLSSTAPAAAFKQHGMPASLAEWNATNPAAPRVEETEDDPYAELDAPKPIKEFGSIKEWLEAYGAGNKNGNFKSFATRRPSVSRGLQRRGKGHKKPLAGSSAGSVSSSAAGAPRPAPVADKLPAAVP